MSQILLGSVGALRLAEMLREVPENAQRELRTDLRGLGSRVVSTARGNASWSSRIPRSLGVRVTFGRTAAVTITARAAVAPHARPLEGITGAATFRHPFFGGDVWFTQATRPFLAPAAQAHARDLTTAAEQAIEAAIRKSRLS